MGQKQAKPAAVEATTPADAAGTTQAPTPGQGKKSDYDQYCEFRDELMAFSLGEAAHDYSRRLLEENPSSPALMALHGETAWQYEKIKNPTRREHWVDRMDVMQTGIDVARKCIKENPDYAPCHRVYALLAAKMADNEYWFKRFQPFGTIKHYKRIISRGERAVALHADPDVYGAMAQTSARVATQIKHSWQPYVWYARYYGLPTRTELLERARDYHIEFDKINNKNIENACRLGMVYFELGDEDKAKRWYRRARDELVSDNPAQDIYQTIAHTALATHFAKTTWNVPFG